MTGSQYVVTLHNIDDDINWPIAVGPFDTREIAEEYADLITKAYKSGGGYPEFRAEVRDLVNFSGKDLDILRGAVEIHEREMQWQSTLQS